MCCHISYLRDSYIDGTHSGGHCHTWIILTSCASLLELLSMNTNQGAHYGNIRDGRGIMKIIILNSSLLKQKDIKANIYFPLRPTSLYNPFVTK